LSAKILVLDIERQSALVDGVWQLGSRGSSWINPDRIIEPSRTICFAYHWIGSNATEFAAEWDGGMPQDNRSATPGGGHYAMIARAHALFDAADYVVGWNSKNFDIKHLKYHFWMYDMKPPSPHVDIDLMQQCSRNFAPMAKSLSYITKIKGMEGKASTTKGLWHALRWATGDELRAAQREMKLYNIQDVDQTVEVFYDMRGWLSGMNVGLYDDDGGIRCSNCGSDHIQYRGQAGNRTYKYKRFQCVACGKWGRDAKSFESVPSLGIPV
jgi:hypothetical protein